MIENVSLPCSFNDFKPFSTVSPKREISTWTYIFLYITVAICIIAVLVLLYKLFGNLFKKMFRRRYNLANEPAIHFNVHDLPDDDEEENEVFRPAGDLRGFGLWPVPRHGRFWPLGNEARLDLPREAGGGDNHLRRLPNTHAAPSPQRLTGRGDMNILPFDPAVIIRNPRAQLRIRPQYRRRLQR